MKVGLVGLPGSGKTSLFTAMTAVEPQASDYGKSTSRMIKVPDARLEELRGIYEPKKFTLADLEVHDFPGVDRSAVRGNASFFAAIREMDVIAVVLRSFEGGTYPFDPAEADALRDWEALLVDFQISDLEMIERRIERLRKTANKPTKTQADDKLELACLERCQEAVEDGRRLVDIEFSDREHELLAGFGFLTRKPTMVVLNVDDDSDGADVLARFEGQTEKALALRARLEAEIALLDPEEADEFKADFGIEEQAADTVTRGLYDLLGLHSFFTVGPDEVRAWTIRVDDDAVTSAGKIHSDIARGFIRAEVCGYDDFMAAGDMKVAKERNHVRLEGKEYAVQDGDIINFRFSV